MAQGMKILIRGHQNHSKRQADRLDTILRIEGTYKLTQLSMKMI
jgi:hypothetical protein